MIRQERNGNTTTWTAQGNVNSVPLNSKDLDVYADPSGREDEKRKALSAVADAMEAVLQKEKPLKEHPNRGLLAKIIQEMGGDEERYNAAFKKAGLGELPNDRARVAKGCRSLAAALRSREQRSRK